MDDLYEYLSKRAHAEVQAAEDERVFAILDAIANSPPYDAMHFVYAPFIPVQSSKLIPAEPESPIMAIVVEPPTLKLTRSSEMLHDHRPSSHPPFNFDLLK